MTKQDIKELTNIGLRRIGYCIYQEYTITYSIDGGLTYTEDTVKTLRDKIYLNLKMTFNALHMLRKQYPKTKFTYHIVYENILEGEE